MTWWIAWGLVALGSLAACVPAAHAQTTTNVVATADLKLRAHPSSSSLAVSSVPEGYPVILGACNAGWCEVRYMGVRGFVPESRLTQVDVAVRARVPNPRDRDRAEQADEPSLPRRPERSGPVRPLCKGSFDDAEAFFSLGAYTETIGRLAVCATDATLSPDEAASAHRMLALAHFYEGNTRAAQRTLVELLDRDPDYEPSYALDPPAYVALVQGLKLERKLITPLDFQCDRRVASAQERYVEGDYEATRDVLDECLNEGRLAKPVARRAHRLVALAYMKQDRADEARQTVSALLETVPNYRADAVQDLPAYVALVDDVRKEIPERRVPWGW